MSGGGSFTLKYSIHILFRAQTSFSVRFTKYIVFVHLTTIMPNRCLWVSNSLLDLLCKNYFNCVDLIFFMVHY